MANSPPVGKVWRRMRVHRDDDDVDRGPGSRKMDVFYNHHGNDPEAEFRAETTRVPSEP
jgi:hypothetical protein